MRTDFVIGPWGGGRVRTGFVIGRAGHSPQAVRCVCCVRRRNFLLQSLHAGTAGTCSGQETWSVFATCLTVSGMNEGSDK